MSDFCNYTTNQILSMDINGEIWSHYNDISSKMYSSAKQQQYRKNEFDTYYMIVENIANYIRNNYFNINPIIVCGILVSLINSNNTWFYNNGSNFIYDDDFETDRKLDELNDLYYSSNDLNYELREEITRLENSRVGNIQNFLCLGAEVVRGRGCCRHTSSFFRDILRCLGYEAYVIGNSIKNSTSDVEVFSNRLNDDYYMELPNFSLVDNGVCDDNHMCVIFPFDDDFMMFDPTQSTLASISGDKAKDYTFDLVYQLSIPSLMRYEQLPYEAMMDLYNRFCNSNFVVVESVGADYHLVESKKYYRNSFYIYYGIDNFFKVGNTPEVLKHIELLNEFNYHFNNIELYKSEMMREKYLKMI